MEPVLLGGAGGGGGGGGKLGLLHVRRRGGGGRGRGGGKGPLGGGGVGVRHESDAQGHRAAENGAAAEAIGASRRRRLLRASSIMAFVGRPGRRAPGRSLGWASDTAEAGQQSLLGSSRACGFAVLC